MCVCVCVCVFTNWNRVGRAGVRHPSQMWVHRQNICFRSCRAQKGIYLADPSFYPFMTSLRLFMTSLYPFMTSLYQFMTNLCPFMTNLYPFMTNLYPFMTNLCPFMTNLCPFMTNLYPFMTNLCPFMTNLYPFMTNLCPFMTGLYPFMTSSVRRQFYLALLDYSNAESMGTMDSLGVKAIRMCVCLGSIYIVSCI